jgi:hypothetical protein
VARDAVLRRQFVFGCVRLQIFELKLHLLEQPGLAFRAAAVELAPELLDLQLQSCNQRLRPGTNRRGAAASASASMRAARSARIIAWGRRKIAGRLSIDIAFETHVSQ